MKKFVKYNLIRCSFAALLLLSLHSCTVKKRIEKSKSETKTETTETTKSTETGTNSLNSVNNRTTLESFNKPIQTERDSLTGSFTQDQLNDGRTHEIESSGQILEVQMKDGSLSVKSVSKPKTLQALGSRTVISKEDVKAVSGFTASADQSIKVKSEVKIEDSKKSVDRTWSWLNWLWWLLLVIPIGFAWKKREKIVKYFLG